MGEQQPGWVLVGTYYDTGLPKYHAEDTAIGPCSTAMIDEAHVFGTREDACRSSGFTHWSSNSVPVLLADALRAEPIHRRDGDEG